MRRFFSSVAFLGLTWLPSLVAAQDEQPPPPPVGVDVEVEPTPPPPPPAPEVDIDTTVEAPPPAPPDYSYTPEVEDTGFLVELAPYGYLPLRVDGSTAVAGTGTSTSVRVKDLFEGDQLNIGGGLRLEAWRDRLGLIADGQYLQLERDADGVGGDDFRSRQFIGDFFAAFRVVQAGPLVGGPSMAFAVTGGLRLIYDRERVELAGNAVERDDWIAKGSLGGDMPFRISDTFGLRARGQVRYPDFDWSMTALAQFDGLPVGLDLGYRYENLDYEEGPLDLNVHVHSAMVGLRFKAFGQRQDERAD